MDVKGVGGIVRSWQLLKQLDASQSLAVAHPAVPLAAILLTGQLIGSRVKNRRVPGESWRVRRGCTELIFHCAAEHSTQQPLITYHHIPALFRQPKF